MTSVPTPPQRVINLTPTTLRVRTDRGHVRIASSGVLRPGEHRTALEATPHDGEWLQTSSVAYDVDSVLPARREGVLLIVPRVIALLSDRDDLRIAVEAGTGYSVLGVIE